MAKKHNGGKKKKQPPPKILKEVKITAKRPKTVQQTSVTKSGEVPTRRIDSLKKANPALGKVIGNGYKGSGGKTTYGDDASDAIKAGLKKKS